MKKSNWFTDHNIKKINIINIYWVFIKMIFKSDLYAKQLLLHKNVCPYKGPNISRLLANQLQRHPWNDPRFLVAQASTHHLWFCHLKILLEPIPLKWNKSEIVWSPQVYWAIPDLNHCKITNFHGGLNFVYFAGKPWPRKLMLLKI